MTTLRAVAWATPARADEISAALVSSFRHALDDFDAVTIDTLEPAALSFGVSALPGLSPVVFVGARHTLGADGDARFVRWLDAAGARAAVYEVEEALPLDYERTWADCDARRSLAERRRNLRGDASNRVRELVGHQHP